MNEQTIQIALAQLALLIFTSMALVSQSKPALWLAIILMLSLSFSLGTALAMINKFYNKKMEELKQQHAATLGTHIGGAICYMVLLNLTLNKIY
jgi:hypothetical protein